jgi:hypothetical protein
MNKFSRVVLISSIVAVTALFGAQFAAAQTVGQGIQVKPAIIEANVRPGQLYNFTFTFTNIGATDQTFYLNAQDIKGLDNAGLPIFAAPGEATGYELSSWIHLPTGSITLQAGQSQTFNLTAQVPMGVSPGAHFGGVFVTNQPPKLNANGSGVGLSVGGIMSLTVAGDIVESASLQEFSTDNQVYSVPAVSFNTKIQNSGNVLVSPHGIIVVTDMLGHQVGSISVNDSAAPVFPASERVYTAKWAATGLAFGRYEAVGSFSYGDTEKKTISGSTSFWILPWKPIALFLGSILAIVLLMYAAIRMYIRRKLREMGISGKDRADMNFYAQKYQRSGSRLIVVTLVIFLFCVIFLSVLFFVFA